MKQQHARGIAFVLVVLLLLHMTAAPAFALTFPGSGSSSTGPVYLCGAADDIDKKLMILEPDEPVSTHISKLPANGEAWIYFATNGSMQMVPVNWQTDDPVLLEPGLHVMRAQATTSSSIQLADGYDGIVTWPVFRKGRDDNPVNAVLQLQSLQTPGIHSPLIEENSDTSRLSETLQLTEHVTECKVSNYWLLDTKNDSAFRWVWDTSAVDSSHAGYHKITAVLEHPEWVAVPEEYRSLSEAVFVMPADRIELWAPVSVDVNGKLTFRWLYEAQNVTGAALQWKTADTAYQPCEDSWYTFISANRASNGSLLLNLHKLPVNTPLNFQLSYYDTIDGVTAQYFTEPITITIPENLDELLHKNITTLLDELTGDRDGGDRGETTLPDYSQPAPVTPPEENENNTGDNSDRNDSSGAPDNSDNADNSDDSNNTGTSSGSDNASSSDKINSSDNTVSLPVQETVTDTYTEIGGKRLALLVRLDDSVLFEKQGISAEIPSTLLANLALTENQLLKVTLLHPDTNTVQISVLADGQHVDDLTGTTISMPWELSDSSDNTELFCSDHSGNIISPAIYDTQRSIICFTIHAPGTYHIMAQPLTAAPDVETNNTPVTETLPDDEKNPVDNTNSRTLADIRETKPADTTNISDASDTSDSSDVSDVSRISAASDILEASGPETAVPLLPVAIPVILLVLTVFLFTGRWRR